MDGSNGSNGSNERRPHPVSRRQPGLGRHRRAVPRPSRRTGPAGPAHARGPGHCRGCRAGRLRQPAPQEPRSGARPDGRGPAAVRPGRRAQRLPFGPPPPRHRAPGWPNPPRLTDRRDDGAGLGRERGHPVRGPSAGPRRAGPAAEAAPRGPRAPLLPWPVRGGDRRDPGHQRGHRQVHRRPRAGRAGPRSGGAVMTRTEERLRDALGASAARVRDDRLRPLPALETAETAKTPETTPRRYALRRHTLRRHMGWLGPAAAAISVLLIVALALTVSGQGHKSHKATPPVSYPALPAGFPKYFAQMTNSSNIPGPSQHDVVIRSTSTGAEITRAAVPDVPDWRLTPQTVAAAPDGRTFYIAYQAVDLQKNTSQTWIYQLTFTHGGSSNYLAWIKGDPFPGSGLLVNGGSMAVSPDGTKLAFTGATQQQDGQSWPDEISVVDLRTGAGSMWRVGLSRPGQTFTIPGISWTSDGRSLVFRAVWCHPIPNSDVCLDDP